jgi:arabinofuranosyltransferase
MTSPKTTPIDPHDPAAASPESAPRIVPGDPSLERLLLGLFLLFFGVVVLRMAWIGDDAFITLRTVDNFVRGHGLRWNVAERVQSYSHPLWMLLLSVPYFFTREAYFTTLALSVALSLGAVWILVRRVAAAESSAAIALVALLFSRSFMDFTTSGLENPLAYFLVVVFFRHYFTGESDRGARWLLRLFLLAALVALTRLDLLLLLLPPLARALCAEGARGGRARALFFGLAPLAAWSVFSLLYYGFVFPNTYYAKLHTGVSRLALLGQGACYLLNIVGADPVTPVVIALALVVALRRRDPSERAVAAGILLYVLYLFWIGGDFMRGRFYSVPFLLAVLLLCRLPSPRLDSPAALLLLFSTVLLGFLAPDAPIFSNASYGVGKTWDDAGISDERGYWYKTTGLLRTTRAFDMPTDKKRREGKGDSKKGKIVVQKYGVGMYGYYAGPDVHIVDELGLCDPLLGRLAVLDKDKWRIGHFRRVRPNGYLATLKDGKNRIFDPSLARYYDKLSLVVRGDLFSLERLATIARMSLGLYDRLLVDHSFDDGPVLRRRLSEGTIASLRGRKWNDDGVLTLFRKGLELDLEKTLHTARIEAELIGDVSYRFVFRQGKKILGEVTIAVVQKKRELFETAVYVPVGIVREGYDRIDLLPVKSDKMAGVGRLILYVSAR